MRARAWPVGRHSRLKRLCGTGPPQMEGYALVLLAVEARGSARVAIKRTSCWLVMDYEED